MGQNLYRKVSLDRISSPEQIDELMQITSPKSWLALIAIGCILLSAVVWAFTGSIPTKVYGQGILLNNGGVFLSSIIPPEKSPMFGSKLEIWLRRVT